jgi:hypothetical protein
MKKCKYCNQWLEINNHNFVSSKTSKDGFENKCKSCKKEYDKQRLILNKEIRYAKCREWNKLNKEKIIKSTQNWIQNNPGKHKEIKKKAFKKFISNPENKNKRREYDKEYIKHKRQNDLNYRIKDSVGSIINYHLKERKNESTIKFLGCSIEEFKLYLEQQFKPEMNWENYGTIWEIDHKNPFSSFNLTQEEDIYKAFNYLNTQPLFKTTEIAKNFGYTNQIGNRNKSNKLI